MNKARLYLRLKAESTKATGSLIEVFERGLQNDIVEQRFEYQEVAINTLDIVNILDLAMGVKKVDLPVYLFGNTLNNNGIISISQRLIELLPAILTIREKYCLKWNVSVFINTVITAIAPLETCLPLLNVGDNITVNTPFAANCIAYINGSLVKYITIRAPIPELCLLGKTKKIFHESNRKKFYNLACFSRINPDKNCHEVIKAIRLLPNNWKLSIYGMNKKQTTYERYLYDLIKKLGVERRVSLKPQLISQRERLTALLEADIVVNTSTSFEETMGKVILEALSWGKPVIANCWNGFIDILPEEDLISTYWDEQNWYHVKAADIASCALKMLGTTSVYNVATFQHFLNTRDKLHSTTSKLNSTPNNIPRGDKDEMDKWIKRPRYMMLIKSQFLNQRFSNELGKLFAPKTMMPKSSKYSIPSNTFHPKLIVAYCYKNKLDPLQYLENWLETNHNSPYISFAELFISESKQYFNESL